MSGKADTGVTKLSENLLQSDKLRRVHQVWVELKAERPFPLRAEISPERLGFILGQVTIIDVLREPLNFRYRLVGTKIEDAGRRGDKGKTIDQVEPEAYRQMVVSAFQEVVETGQPVFQQISYLHHQTVVSFERLVLPFSQSGGEVDVLLEASDWPPGVHQDLRNIDFSRTQDLTPDTD